ncbi:hypothetical protein CDCA_CDCA09G2594 [Cyanidium caldarium]|uniref:FH2 domain-containing protein n=1 Tax=Cyanidium caldarium TaxID=2771 RepID=A0AAV9IWS4_CYACA|nr:hypothetical protein CDCA_CDCA09G2594 [Cyanidium caldarium]
MAYRLEEDAVQSIQRRLLIAEAVARAATLPRTQVVFVQERRGATEAAAVGWLGATGSVDAIQLNDDQVRLRVGKFHIKRVSPRVLRLLLAGRSSSSSGGGGDPIDGLAYRVEFGTAAEADGWQRLLGKLQRVAVLREELVVAMLEAEAHRSPNEATSPPSIEEARRPVLRGRPQTGEVLMCEGGAQYWLRAAPLTDHFVPILGSDNGRACGSEYCLTADDVGHVVAALLPDGTLLRTEQVITIDDELRATVERFLSHGEVRIDRERARAYAVPQTGRGAARRRKRPRRVPAAVRFDRQGIRIAQQPTLPWDASHHLTLDATDARRMQVARWEASGSGERSPSSTPLIDIRAVSSRERDCLALTFRAFRSLALMGVEYVPLMSPADVTSNRCWSIVRTCTHPWRCCVGVPSPPTSRPSAGATPVKVDAATACHDASLLAPASTAADTTVVLSPTGEVSVLHQDGSLSMSAVACAVADPNESLMGGTHHQRATETAAAHPYVPSRVAPIPPGTDAAANRNEDERREQDGDIVLSAPSSRFVHVPGTTAVKKPAPSSWRFGIHEGAPPRMAQWNVAALSTAVRSPMDDQPLVPRRLHWTCVPPFRIRGSIWSTVSPYRWQPDERELVTLFARTTATTAGGTGKGAEPDDDVAAAATPSSTRYVQILDAKTARNLDIMLGKFKHLSFAHIIDALLQGDVQRLGDDFLSILSSMVPSPEEQQRIAEAAAAGRVAPEAQLLRPELFTLQLCTRVPRVAAKTAALLTTHTFAAAVRDLHEAAEVITCACNQLCNSERFRGVLELLLALGNVLNEGSARQRARGFTIESLGVVTNVRGLLHYVIAVLRAQPPSVARLTRFMDDLPHVAPASKIELDALSTGFSELEHDLQELITEMERCGEADAERAFGQHLQRWLPEAQRQLDELRHAMREMDEALEDTLSFLPADDTADVASRSAGLRDQLFVTVLRFEQAWTRCLRDENAAVYAIPDIGSGWRLRSAAETAEQEEMHRRPEMPAMPVSPSEDAVGFIPPPPPPPPPPPMSLLPPAAR